MTPVQYAELVAHADASWNAEANAELTERLTEVANTRPGLWLLLEPPEAKAVIEFWHEEFGFFRPHFPKADQNSFEAGYTAGFQLGMEYALRYGRLGEEPKP